MRVLLHIGAHKTGTTSIQSTMMHSSGALAERGLLYPRCCWAFSGHHRLAYAMKGKADPTTKDAPDLDQELNDLSRVLNSSNARTCLISSEEFFTAPRLAISKVAEGLGRHDVEIVAYVRRPDELVQSAFNQKLKQIYQNFHKDSSVGYYIDDFLESPEKIIADIDYNRYISNWADVFGDSRVRLVQYEVADAIESMCEILGVDRSMLADVSDQENLRASGKLVALLRLAREMNASVPAQERLRDLAWRKFPHRQGGGGSLLDPRDRLRLLERYRKGNQALFKRFLGADNPYDPEHVVPEQEIGVPEDGLRMRDLMQIILDLIAPPNTTSKPN
jgi:hypothetical protein